MSLLNHEKSQQRNLYIAGSWSISFHLVLFLTLLGPAASTQKKYFHKQELSVLLQAETKVETGIKEEYSFSGKEHLASNHLPENQYAWREFPEWMLKQNTPVVEAEVKEEPAIPFQPLKLQFQVGDHVTEGVLLELEINIDDLGIVKNINVLNSQLDENETKRIVKEIYETYFIPAKINGGAVESVQILKFGN
ncbi:hypothetical protein [Chitinolyticbacter albus]|uniref:hypothetical protein n=1 Tax=Chitinolyticbacter albus TaxID=2961951 RepID=UPI002108CC6E|nr:hypothetical protein [Chitinolyticbacter albus]